MSKEKFSFNISEQDKKKALAKALKKGSREQELGLGSLKGGAHKNKKKYSRKNKHKKNIN